LGAGITTRVIFLKGIISKSSSSSSDISSVGFASSSLRGIASLAPLMLETAVSKSALLRIIWKIISELTSSWMRDFSTL